MNNKVLIPMSGEKGTPIPNSLLLCELINGVSLLAIMMRKVMNL